MWPGQVDKLAPKHTEWSPCSGCTIMQSACGPIKGLKQQFTNHYEFGAFEKNRPPEWTCYGNRISKICVMSMYVSDCMCVCTDRVNLSKHIRSTKVIQRPAFSERLSTPNRWRICQAKPFHNICCTIQHLHHKSTVSRRSTIRGWCFPWWFSCVQAQC